MTTRRVILLLAMRMTHITTRTTHIQPIPIEMTFFKAQSSKLVGLFSLVRSKRDLRALSFGLRRMSFQLGLAVRICIYVLMR